MTPGTFKSRGTVRLSYSARGVAELRSHAGPGLVDAHDLGTLALLLGDAPSLDLLQFADRMLGGLMSGEESRRSALLDTLRAWMQTGCSIAATAERLGVHTNTVTYRLKRIADLLGHDLHSYKTRMDLQLALTVWDVTSRDR